MDRESDEQYVTSKMSERCGLTRCVWRASVRSQFIFQTSSTCDYLAHSVEFTSVFAAFL